MNETNSGDGPFKLPHDTAGLKALRDQREAKIADLAERYGTDAEGWPAYECLRINAISKRIDIALQENWEAIYREADRLDISHRRDDDFSGPTDRG